MKEEHWKYFRSIQKEKCTRLSFGGFSSKTEKKRKNQVKFHLAIKSSIIEKRMVNTMSTHLSLIHILPKTDTLYAKLIFKRVPNLNFILLPIMNTIIIERRIEEIAYETSVLSTYSYFFLDHNCYAIQNYKTHLYTFT